MNKASSLVLSWRGKVRIANQFWRLADYESFAASEVALYAFLVNECNKFHWQMPFSCPTFHVYNRLRMSKQTLVTAKERLAKRKLKTNLSNNGVVIREKSLRGSIKGYKHRYSIK